MARYLSVEETAEVLKASERTIRRMLNDQRLPGSQYMDKGRLVWRVHATKELLQKLEKSYGDSGIPVEAVEIVEEQVNTAPGQRIDLGKGMDDLFEEQSPKGEPESFTNQVVETVWAQLASKFFEKLEQKDHAIGQKDQLIGELRAEILDKDRRLKLLPDLEKIAEEERKAAQMKAFEVEALRKQVAALQRPWWKKMFGKTANKLNSIAD